VLASVSVFVFTSMCVSMLGGVVSRGTHCNTLQNTATCSQHTATHCIKLQHTATHCNTPQHTATHRNMLPTHCNTLHQTATHCIKLHHTATHCNTLQHTATCSQHTWRTAPHSNTHSGGRAASLQHTPTHCNTPQHAATHTATYCNILQHTPTQR